MPKDSIKYSEKSKYIIGTTSLWLILPIYYGLDNFIKKKSIFSLYLSIVMSICTIISTTMWKDRNNSFILYYLDIFFAKILFTSLLISNIYVKSKYIGKFNKIFFPSIIILLYIKTSYFYKKYYINISTIFHTLFRYFGCLWCHLLLVPNIYTFTFPLSFVYFGNVIYAWIKADYINNYIEKFSCKKYYNKDCLNIINLMISFLVANNIIYIIRKKYK